MPGSPLKNTFTNKSSARSAARFSTRTTRSLRTTCPSKRSWLTRPILTILMRLSIWSATSQNLRGIYLEHDATRIYPNGSMLCHVIGFTDFEHHGIQGVEASMEEYLHGQDGYRYIEHNRAGQEIVLYRGQERASRN